MNDWSKAGLFVIYWVWGVIVGMSVINALNSPVQWIIVLLNIIGLIIVLLEAVYYSNGQSNIVIKVKQERNEEG